MQKSKTQTDRKRQKTQPSDFSDLPLPYLPGQPRLEIIGNSCLVDGLDKILEYTPGRIRLAVGKKEITFNGDSLCINSFSYTGAVIEGFIMSMEFSGE